MKKLALSLLLPLLLVGCATRYEIVTRNGAVTTSKGKPKLVDGAYVFTDVLDRKRQFPAVSVYRIYPSSDRTDPENYFQRSEQQETLGYRSKPTPWYRP